MAIYVPATSMEIQQHNSVNAEIPWVRAVPEKNEIRELDDGLSFSFSSFSVYSDAAHFVQRVGCILEGNESRKKSCDACFCLESI